MATEKTTVMVLNLKADLQCPCCYKKIKKLLCKFPQIKDQVYDEKANVVIITVVCCSPEKIRDKLCCKGGKLIKSIDIKEPPTKPTKPPNPAPPPQQPEKPKEAPKPIQHEKPMEVPKPKEPEKPKEVPKPKEPEKPKEAPKPSPPKETEKPKEVEKPKEAPKPKEPEKPKEAPPLPPPQKVPEPPPPSLPMPRPMPEPVRMMPPPNMFPAHGFPQAVPTGYCCMLCYDGFPGGPCYHGGGYHGVIGDGRPVVAPPTYDYNYGGKPCYVTRCDYFSEENPQGCSIM